MFPSSLLPDVDGTQWFKRLPLIPFLPYKLQKIIFGKMSEDDPVARKIFFWVNHDNKWTKWRRLIPLWTMETQKKIFRKNVRK